MRYWTFHVSLNAAPSFVFALLVGWKRPESIVGMLLGILLFILGFARIWSSRWLQRVAPWGGLVRNAVRCGTWLRSGYAVAECLATVMTFRFISVDVMAGAMAQGWVSLIGKSEPLRSWRILLAGSEGSVRAKNILVGTEFSFIPTVLITLTEGVLLTGMLLALAGGASVILALYQPRRRRMSVAV